jgi:hypothetical protein
MTKGRATIVGTAVIALIAGAIWGGWDSYKPILRWREGRALGRARSAVQDYVQGQQSLDVSVRRLASALVQFEALWERLSPSSGVPGSLSAEPFALAPPGVSEDDPRIVDLYTRALKEMIPADVSPEFRRQTEAMFDSARARALDHSAPRAQ